MKRTPEEILTAHVSAVTRGDLPGILQDYRDDAVLLTPHGALNGRAGVEQFFSGAIATLPGLQVSATSLISAGDAVMISWTGSSPAGTISDGVDTFVFADDLIKIQATSFTVHPAGSGSA